MTSLPTAMTRLVCPPVLLRPFEDGDVDLVRSVADDPLIPLIPLITTVTTSGTREDALAYIGRQHDRLPEGQGYSFAIADAADGHAVGQIGLWTRDIDAGRTTTGYWVAPPFRRRGYLTAALAGLTEWALGHDEVHRIELTSSHGMTVRGARPRRAGTNAKGGCAPGSGSATCARTSTSGASSGRRQHPDVRSLRAAHGWMYPGEPTPPGHIHPRGVTRPH